MASMMDDLTFKKMGRAMSHPTGQMLAKPVSMLVNPFTVSQIGLAFNRLKGALTDPACKVKGLSEVKTGDHIVLRPKKANLVDRMMMGQHAIVQGVNRDKNTILIIHYHSEVFKKKANSQRLHVKSLITGKVIQSKIRFNKDFDVYKINHDSSYTVQMVLDRAKARLGEKDFNFFLNNDEHFAYFCKTGTPRSCRNKMYVLKMAQFTVKLYCLGQSIYLMLGLNSGVATYFYRRTTRVKTHTKKETAIKAKEMATAGVFYGFLNNWLLLRSTSASNKDVDTKKDVLQDENAMQVAIPAPNPPRCRRRKPRPKFKPHPGEDRQKVMELGSQLVVRAVSQTVVKSVAKSGARHMAKEAMKKGVQSVAKKAGERVAHHAGKSALHHAAKGAAVKTAVTSAGKSSGHGVAGVLRAAARGQGLAIGMGALVSVGFATKDIMRAKKDIKAGAISADEYNTVVTRKVAGATTDIAMGTYGAVMGTLMAGPIGAVVGGFMGSMVGSMVGEEIGEELDKNNIGLKWAPKEDTGQGNMGLAKITEIEDAPELQKEHPDISEYPRIQNSEELNALKSDSTPCETDTNDKDPHVLECKMQEELKLSTQRTDNGTDQASGGQGEDLNPVDQAQPQVGELFGEYFDSIFNRKKTKETENDMEGKEQEGQSYKFAKGLWGSFFGNTEDDDDEEIVAGDQSIGHSGNVKDAIQEPTVESDQPESTGGLNQIYGNITSMPEVNQGLPVEPVLETAKAESTDLEVNSQDNEGQCPPEKSATKTVEVDASHDVIQSDSSMYRVESSPVTETVGNETDNNEEVELKSIPQGTHGQSYTFAKGLWGSFFGNTEDEDDEEIVAGDQSIDHSCNVKDAIQETTVESDQPESTGGLNQINNNITSMPEVNQGPPVEPVLETAKAESTDLEVNSQDNEGQCRPEKLATKTVEVDATHDVIQSDSSMDRVESSPVTETDGTETDNNEGVELKSIPQGTHVAEPAAKDQQQTTGFSFFGFGKTTLGKVISSIVQDIVSDDYQDTNNDPEGESGGRHPAEDVSASRPGGESNKTEKAEAKEEDKTAVNTIERNPSSGNAPTGTLKPVDGNDMQIKDDDIEGDDSCDAEDVVTSDTDEEDSNNTLTVTADVHTKQHDTEDTVREESVTTDDMLRDPNKNTAEEMDKHGGTCSEAPVTDITMEETATTYELTRDTTEKRDQDDDNKRSEGSVSGDKPLPVHSSIEDNFVGDIAMEAIITTPEPSTDVIITIEEEDESKVKETEPRLGETEPTVEETKPTVEETKPKETEPTVDETEPTIEETERTVEETESTVEETEPKETKPTVEETEPTLEETEPTVEANEPTVEENEPRDEENNSMFSVGECEPETHYMVDSDHILPRNNITDYYSITWSVEAEDTGEVIDTGLIEDEMTIRNIIKEFAQTAPNRPESNIELDCNLNIGGSSEAVNNNMLQRGIINEDNRVSNPHDSQNINKRPTMKVGAKEKVD